MVSKTLLLRPNVVKMMLRMYEDVIIGNAYLLCLNAFDYVYEMTTVLLRIFENFLNPAGVAQK